MIDKESVPIPGRSMPIGWVTETLSVSRRTLSLLIREGFVEVDQEGNEPVLRPEMIDRVRLIMALRNELGVNMAGVEIILRLRHQLIWYRNRTRKFNGDSCIDIDQ